MISDFVKGKKKFDYPEGIQKGIHLHRLIDAYTDTHPATARAKEIFRPHYRLYSGAVIDVLYDHFLATDPGEFTTQSLSAFANTTYTIIGQYTQWLPAGFAAMFPYMQTQNWLLGYSTRQGIQKSLGGLVRRAAYLTESDTAFDLFETNYQLLQDCYRQFWADARPYVREQFDSLLLMRG
jgi:acyl carrier protein phosphodiesterase